MWGVWTERHQVSPGRNGPRQDLHEDQAWKPANPRREGKNVEEELAMRMVEETGYSPAVQENRQPLVCRQGVVDMTYLEGRVSESVLEVILSVAESEVD